MLPSPIRGLPFVKDLCTSHGSASAVVFDHPACHPLPSFSLFAPRLEVKSLTSSSPVCLAAFAHPRVSGGRAIVPLGRSRSSRPSSSSRRTREKTVLGRDRVLEGGRLLSLSASFVLSSGISPDAHCGCEKMLGVGPLGCGGSQGPTGKISFEDLKAPDPRMGGACGRQA